MSENEFDDEEDEELNEESLEDEKEVYEIVGTSDNLDGVAKKQEDFDDEEDEDDECCEDCEECEVEIDILEFGLNDSDIEELIAKLLELRETKQQVEFDLDDENKFIINYENDFDDEDLEDEMEGENE